MDLVKRIEGWLKWVENWLPSSYPSGLKNPYFLLISRGGGRTHLCCGYRQSSNNSPNTPLKLLRVGWENLAFWIPAQGHFFSRRRRLSKIMINSGILAITADPHYLEIPPQLKSVHWGGGSFLGGGRVKSGLCRSPFVHRIAVWDPWARHFPSAVLPRALTLSLSRSQSLAPQDSRVPNQRTRDGTPYQYYFLNDGSRQVTCNVGRRCVNTEEFQEPRRGGKAPLSQPYVGSCLVGHKCIHRPCCTQSSHTKGRYLGYHSHPWGGEMVCWIPYPAHPLSRGRPGSDRPIRMRRFPQF